MGANASPRVAPRLIRINPREFDVTPGKGVGIAGAALEALDQIEQLLHGSVSSN
jgi:hypothetical protein